MTASSDILSQAGISDNLSDALTLLPDHRAFYQWSQQLTNEKFSLVLVDISGFAKISSRFGKSAGHKIINELADHFRKLLKKEDLLFRIQSDEFVMVRPEISDEWIQSVIKSADHLKIPLPVIPNEKPNHVKIFAAGSSTHSEHKTVDAVYLHAYQSIVRLKRKLSPVGSPDPAVPETTMFPQRNKIVHRAAELELLHNKLNQSLLSHGNIVFIEGQPGIGKTKVINYFLETVREIYDPFILIGAAQHIHTPPPYHAVKKALLRFLYQSPEEFYAYLKLLDESNIRELFQFLPELDIERLPELRFDKPSKQFDYALFDALLKFISLIADDRKLVFWLEDFHDADAGSWQFVKYLSVNIRHKNIVVIISSREIDYENDNYPEKMRNTFLELKNSPDTHFHKMKPFDLKETADYCAEFKFFKRLPPKGIEFIFNLTKGNPLYIYEISKYLVSNTRLIQKIDKGSLPVEQFEIPETVQDVVMAELSHLSKDEKEFTRFLATMGFEISVEVSRTILRWNIQQIQRLIDNLKFKNILVDTISEPNNHRVQFSHPMIRTVIYNTMSMKKRRGFHLMIAESMERYIDYSVDIVLLADHYYLAAEWDKAYKYSIACALQAKQVYAYETSYQFFSRAREIAKIQYNDDSFSEMVQKEGEMLELLGRYNEAYKRLLKSAKLMEAKNNSFGAANNYLLIGKILHVQGDYQESLKMLKKAKTFISDNVAIYGFILGEECWIYRILGDYDQSLSAGNRALEILGRSAPKRETGLVYNNLAEIFYRLGDYKTAVDYFNKRLDISRMIGDKLSESMSLNNLCELMLAYGKTSEAESFCSQSLQIAREVGNPETLARVLATQAQVHLSNNQLQQAHQILDEAFGVADQSNYQYIRPQLYISRGFAYLLENNLDSAQQHAKSGLTLSTKSKAIEFQGLSLQLLGNIYCQQKNYASALDHYRKSIDLLTPINLVQSSKSLENLAGCYLKTEQEAERETTLKLLDDQRKKINLH